MRQSVPSVSQPLAWRIRLRGCLHLVRPANTVTAWADIATGCAAAAAVAGSWPPAAAIAWLILATTGLYAGGVTLNDFFDARLDAHERPERPIPSGQVPRAAAAILGFALLGAGLLCAAQASAVSGLVAAAVAASVLLYDTLGKQHSLLGPMNMATCRGLNLLLGISIIPAALPDLAALVLIPLLYISAVTAVSRGEVHGGGSSASVLAVLLMVTVLGGLLLLAYLPQYRLPPVLPFVALLAVRVLPPLLRAARNPEPKRIQQAVKSGVLSVIILNAAMAAGFGGITVGLVVLLLWPLSLWLGRLFAVT